MVRKLVIDTDCGIDDAIAILMAIKRCDLCDILAITTCFGNVSVDTATAAAGTILSLFQSKVNSSIPIYKGASSALISPNSSWTSAHSWKGHGANGLGNAEFPEVRPQLPESEHAVEALIKLAKSHPGEIDLVALGPLTNIALAIKMDPNFVSNIRSIYVMGGCHSAKGNISYCAEFNFWNDPESAHLILEEFRADKLYIVPWEVTEDSGLSWQEFHQDIASIPSKEAKFVEKICHCYMDTGETFMPCDAYAMAAFLDPSIVHEILQKHCTVELQGKHTRGMLSLDWYSRSLLSSNASIVSKISKAKFKSFLIDILSKN